MGALLITAFNLFTIIYKMYFAPEGEEDEDAEASEYEYGIIEIQEDNFNELDEDLLHNSMTEDDYLITNKTGS